MFYARNQLKRPNDMYFKMLYNSDIKFNSRLYGQFGCALKLIKIRDSISDIMQRPDSFTKLGGLFQVLKAVVEMRKQDRASFVKSFDLVPSAHALVELELKFGGSLTQEDITSVYKRDKKRRRNHPTSKSVLLGQTATTIKES